MFESNAPSYLENQTLFPKKQVWLGTWLVPLKDKNGMTVSLMGVARDITERKKDEEALQRQLKELSILHDVALAASSSKSVDELIQRVTDTISHALNPDNCGVGLLSENGDMLVPHVSYHGTTGDKSRQRMLTARGVTSKVASTGISIRLADVSQEPAYVETMVGVQSE